MRPDPARPLVGKDLSLAGCYELYRRVRKPHSRTHYFSTSLFPKGLRPHVHALYASMRYTDEIVDNPGATTLAELEAFEERTLIASGSWVVSRRRTTTCLHGGRKPPFM